MTNFVSLKLLSEGQVNSEREPIVSGIPFARGKLFDLERLQLTNAGDEIIPAYFCTETNWPDGSIKWALLYFQVEMERPGSNQIFVGVKDDKNLGGNDVIQGIRIMVDTTDEIISVNTGNALFEIHKKSFKPFNQVFVAGIKQLADYGCRFMMKDHLGEDLKSKVTSIDLGNKLNPLQRTLTLNGGFYGSGEKLFTEATLRLTFFAGLTAVKIDFSVHNPRAAEHPKGIWDLGDKGSILFANLTGELNLNCDKNDALLYVKHETKHIWKPVGSSPYRIYQDSSGGINWQSNNHVNAEAEIPIKFQGYRCFEKDVEIDKGLRANPQFRLGSSSANICIYIKEFWQNFPKSIEVEQNKIRLSLFPDQFSDNFELQGGEQKTHTIYLDFSDDMEALDWCHSPRSIQIDSSYFSNTKAVQLLPKIYCEDDLQKLINIGISGEHSFYKKREIIDEFGWRNFGDMYADHEELEYQGSTPLISHYNNQYDALDGFIRQYIVSGDRRWFDLAAPLAQHIIDIDIYRTVEDKDELNGGLFWHTDHYANAFTSTHRTYSIKNSKSYDGKVGGGPATEHCYTAGLANFFFLTGDPVYKQAALLLVEWIDRLFEGSGTLCERLKILLTKDIPVIKKLVLGRTVLNYRYPFTRGTGNYISSLIDGYQLTGEADYINRVEKIIKQSIHPNDEISLRKLDDSESNWSYLVLLQAICKYLVIKSSNGETDNMYCYASASLLHYANWIMENEEPFLDNTERLDFPNQTWIAQDLRKAYILQVAACFDTANKEKLYLESVTYRNYVFSHLKNDETNHYTRILVILMQNYLSDDGIVEDSIDRNIKLSAQIDYGQAPVYRLSRIFVDIAADLLKCLRRFSLSREIRWFKFRIKIF